MTARAGAVGGSAGDHVVLIGFLGGLVTGISPCILPVLPVIFAAGRGQRPRRPDRAAPATGSPTGPMPTDSRRGPTAGAGPGGDRRGSPDAAATPGFVRVEDPVVAAAA